MSWDWPTDSLEADAIFLQVKEGKLPVGTAASSSNGDNRTLLMLATAYRQPHDVVWLIDAGADIHAKDQSGKTVLHWAAWWGNLRVVQCLIEAGASVHDVDTRGDTPCSSAWRNLKVAVAKYLLTQGANAHGVACGSRFSVSLNFQRNEAQRLDFLQLLLASGAILG